MHTYHYAHTKIENISNTDLQGLFDEIATLRKICKEGFVIQFLHQAFHPLTTAVRVKFDKKKLSTQYYLLMKIRKLEDTEIYKLCVDLALMTPGLHIEDCLGMTVYNFLNKTIVDSKKSKRKKRK